MIEENRARKKEIRNCENVDIEGCEDSIKSEVQTENKKRESVSERD